MSVKSGRFVDGNTVNAAALNAMYSVTVTANGGAGGDGGDFGPNTASTTTAGVQEAINNVAASSAGGGVVYLSPGVNCTGSVSIKSSQIALISLVKLPQQATFTSGLVQVQSILIDSTSGVLANIVLAGLQIQTLTFNCISQTSFVYIEGCNVSSSSTTKGIQIQSSTGNLQEFYVYDTFFDCSSGSASNAITLASGTVSTGQLYFVDCTWSGVGTTPILFNCTGAWGPIILFLGLNAEIGSSATSSPIYFKFNGSSQVDFGFCLIVDSYFETHASTTLVAWSGSIFSCSVWVYDSSFDCAAGTLTMFSNSVTYSLWGTRGGSFRFVNNLISPNGNNLFTMGSSWGNLGPNLDVLFKENTVQATSGSSTVNPVGVVATPFDTTNNVILPNGGGSAGNPTSNTFTYIEGTDIILTVTGGTVTSIVSYDHSQTQVASYGTSCQGVQIPHGFYIKITWSVAPTTTVAFL